MRQYKINCLYVHSKRASESVHSEILTLNLTGTGGSSSAELSSPTSERRRDKWTSVHAATPVPDETNRGVSKRQKK